MNRKPSGSSMLLSRALLGFLSYKEAEGLTTRSVDHYRQHLAKWLEYDGDKEIGKVTPQTIINYLTWLRTEYTPIRFSGKTHPLSNKTLRNHWIVLSSFFNWAHLELCIPDPMEDVPAPKYKVAPVEAFTKEEIEKLLKACAYSREAKTEMRKKFAMKRVTANRDQALILFLLDTGLRAMEFCKLTIGDVDQKTGKVNVKHGVAGGAKGGKGRTVYLGKSARRALWKYLAEREDGENQEAPLFLGSRDHPMNPDSLRHLIMYIARRAGVKNAHPHKFRHTMAITFLRSGGDIFTLQALLGHGSLDMVRHYANIAQVDVEQAHRKASPVDNWRL